MMRPALAAVFVLATACDGGVHGGLNALAGSALAASWAPATANTARDTLTTVTRRVWVDPNLGELFDPAPDGERIALTDWITGDIAVVDLGTGDTTRITRNAGLYDPGYGMFPRFSPDGERLAFSWWNEDRPLDWQLRLADASGGGVHVLIDGVGTHWIHPEDWSPDGRWILALRTREDNATQIILVSPSDGSVRVLKTLDWRIPTRMNFSPDGELDRLRFSAGRGVTSG